MKLNPPTRRRGGFHPRMWDFIVNTISPTIRVDLVEKDSELYPILSLFLVEVAGLEPTVSSTRNWRDTNFATPR